MKDAKHKLSRGTVIGARYRILARKGGGATADVYLAEDPVMERKVILKILAPDYDAQRLHDKSFRTETRALMDLSHPNIVMIYDVSFHAEDPYRYIVMEYIDGITLRRYMESRGVLSAQDVINAARQILNALSQAHAKQIVHRDIKPENMMLTREGIIKVADFGIAKLPKRDNFNLGSVGTAWYVSPEQIEGVGVDGRSDLYSLGVMMYQMATGELPFYEKEQRQVLDMHRYRAPVPPRKLNADIPVGLQQIILKAMEKDPDCRYPDAASMLEEIEKLDRKRNIVFRHHMPMDTVEDENVEPATGNAAGQDAPTYIPTDHGPAESAETQPLCREVPAAHSGVEDALPEEGEGETVFFGDGADTLSDETEEQEGKTVFFDGTVSTDAEEDGTRVFATNEAEEDSSVAEEGGTAVFDKQENTASDKAEEQERATEEILREYRLEQKEKRRLVFRVVSLCAAVLAALVLVCAGVVYFFVWSAVPDYRGMTVEQVSALSESQGVMVDFRWFYDPTGEYPFGTVMAQSPVAGAREYEPDAVTVHMSLGAYHDLPVYQMQGGTVPTNLYEHLPYEQLKSLLMQDDTFSSAGAIISEKYMTSEIHEKGTVIRCSTDFKMGEKEDPRKYGYGTVVTFYISVGSEAEAAKAVMPDVMGLHGAEAQTVLEQAGIRCSFLFFSEEDSHTAPTKWQVTEQSKAIGETVYTEVETVILTVEIPDEAADE